MTKERSYCLSTGLLESPIITRQVLYLRVVLVWQRGRWNPQSFCDLVLEITHCWFKWPPVELQSALSSWKGQHRGTRRSTGSLEDIMVWTSIRVKLLSRSARYIQFASNGSGFREMHTYLCTNICLHALSERPPNRGVTRWPAKCEFMGLGILGQRYLLCSILKT